MGEAGSIADRIAAWRRSGELIALWPDLRREELAEAHGRIRVATAALLRHAEERASLAASGGGTPRALGVAAFLSGMGPLLGWWIERGRLDADPAARAILAGHLDHGRRRIVRLRAELDRIVSALRSNGVDPIVLKGMHTGAAYFPDSATRPAADLDLLVRPEERARSEAALRAAGFVERRRTRWADRSEWVPADASGEVHSLEIDHADDPWSIDLHVALDRWYFRGVRRDLGAPVAATHSVADPGPRGLAQPQLVAFLALHASHDLTKTRLIRMVELALVIRRDGGDTLDFEALAGLLRATDTGRFAYPALALTETLVPGAIPAPLLTGLRRAAAPRALRVMDAVLAADLAPLMHRSLDAKLMWAKGPWETALNLTELIVPSDDGSMEGSALAVQASRLRALLRGGMGWRARG